MLRITKKSLLIVGVLAVIFTFVLSGCDNPFTSDDDDGSSTDGDDTATLDPTSQTPELPDDGDGGNLSQSDESFNGIADFMEPPEDTQSVEVSTISPQKTEKSWTVDGLTVTWIYEESVDKEEWTVRFDGYYDFDEDGKEEEYNDWLFIDAERQKNEYGGFVTVYDGGSPNEGNKAVEWEWCNKDSYYYFVFRNFNDSESLQIATDSRTTVSEGEFDVYSDGGTNLVCGESKSENEMFAAGWTADGGRWDDLTDDSSDGDGSWGDPPLDADENPDVDAPLTSDDDA